MADKNKINEIATLLADYAHISAHSMYRYMMNKAPLRLEMREAQKILTRDLIDILDEVIEKKTFFQEYMDHFVNRAEICVKDELDSFDSRIKDKIIIATNELEGMVKNCFESNIDAMMHKKVNDMQAKIDLLAAEVYNLRKKLEEEIAKAIEKENQLKAKREEERKSMGSTNNGFWV